MVCEPAESTLGTCRLQLDGTPVPEVVRPAGTLSTNIWMSVKALSTVPEMIGCVLFVWDPGEVITGAGGIAYAVVRVVTLPVEPSCASNPSPHVADGLGVSPWTPGFAPNQQLAAPADWTSTTPPAPPPPGPWWFSAMLPPFAPSAPIQSQSSVPVRRTDTVPPAPPPPAASMPAFAALPPLTSTPAEYEALVRAMEAARMKTMPPPCPPAVPSLSFCSPPPPAPPRNTRVMGSKEICAPPRPP